MKYIFFIWMAFPLYSTAQTADTLNGFQQKIKGEEITYFSPLHQFAKIALLTRANGVMPISWQSPIYHGDKKFVTYQFLMGHSTGTSTGDRYFEVQLNDQKLFTITTPMQKKRSYFFGGGDNQDGTFFFEQESFDINGDGFGKLYITVPAGLVKIKAVFTINGQNQNSRDWLMIFMYQKGLKIIAEPTNLVTRKENKRQLNIFVDNPYPSPTPFIVKTKTATFTTNLQSGYNKLHFPAYLPGFTGKDTIQCILPENNTVNIAVNLSPIRNYIFHIIHHSHNDIGYSHLQSEVEQIQNRNIRDAIRWITNSKNTTHKPIWHIESLWAVENFLRTASPNEEKQFALAVKKGQLVLSANYANILTGLCQPEELHWVLAFAKQLEKKYGLQINNAMITDIPGISRSGLLSYVENNIPYLSLGPNYVESLPDKGDRVGGIIKEQGDEIFYWKPDLASKKKLLVWTAGRGYSMFHGIADSEKQASWEKRISEYCNALTEKKYPYDMVQLRYTKNADNGPVDTLLSGFVENWNKQYSAPQLKIASVDELFHEFEQKHGKSLPVFTGEISPYWEDGAYSTALEEMKNRELVLNTIELEKRAKASGKYAKHKAAFYLLQKNILLFHEHTWGAWCSISDPEIAFTTEQWKIKKQFLDSAVYYYTQLEAAFPDLPNQKQPNNYISNLPITNFTIDSLHGGLVSIIAGGSNIVSETGTFQFFEPVYVLGINPAKTIRTKQVEITTTENTPFQKIIKVKLALPSIPSCTVTYTLYKKENRLTCHYSFEKIMEKDKESLHIAFPFNFNNPSLAYGKDTNRLMYNSDQLAGSNRDFICVEKDIRISDDKITAVVSSPLLCLYEVGSIIDENKINGSKVWKNTGGKTSSLFLYVFNNYWHTNYKAYQEGHFDFGIELTFRKNK